MIPWNKLATARAPDGTELSLWRRGEEIVVRVGGVDLMGSRQHGSEEVLAELGCEGLGEGARVLIGGLGLGFTLEATLRLLPRKAEVVVGELIPEIVAWVRDPVGRGALLDDRRVKIAVGNVAELIRASEARFDAIMLDVDNGPAALCLKDNHVLYGPDGLAAARRALKPGGRLAIWSAGADDAFTKRFGKSGFDARAVPIRARREKGARHCIFVGDRPIRERAADPRRGAAPAPERRATRPSRSTR